MYYFIVNPASGSNHGRTIWKTIHQQLDKSQVEYKAFVLSKRGEARTLAASLAESKQPATVIVVGGDGTINETIDGLFTGSCAHITFGCIPTGSGNDFVRGLGLARDPSKALHTILHPKEIRPVNIGTTQCGTASRSFAVSSGIGFDAAVCHSVLDSRLKTALNRFHSGKLVYLFTAPWLLCTMKRQTFRLTVDDCAPQTFEKCYFAAAMNLRYDGGGVQFCPDARPDDDCLDLLIVNGISRLRAVSVLPLAFFGKHTRKKGIHIIRCKKARLQTDQPACVHTDGEIPGFCQEAVFSLHEKKLAVILR